MNVKNSLFDRELFVEVKKMSGYLFVTTAGSKVSRKDNSLSIKNRDGSVEIPIGAIEHIFLFGGVHITTPTIRFVTSKGRYIFMLNRFGKIMSVVLPDPLPSDYKVRLAQYKLLNNEAKKLEVIEYLLRIKAKNVGYVINYNESRYNRGIYIEALLDRIKFDSVQEALGIDGSLNATLFDFLRRNIISPGFVFKGREYHPPRDPVNALLSLTYSIYYSLLIPISISFGFDPYIGFFHKKRGKHAAFCSDVIEISRPWLTLFVFHVVNDGFFEPGDFEKTSGDNCYLKQKALKAYVKLFSERVIHGKSSFLDYSIDFLKKLRELIL